MNEMGDLADGDLTVRATVTEDITGAIADSVNYTIEELSVLVRRINDAAVPRDHRHRIRPAHLRRLLSATERQAQELRLAGETAQRMASSDERRLRRRPAVRPGGPPLPGGRQKGAAAVEDTIRA